MQNNADFAWIYGIFFVYLYSKLVIEMYSN